MTAGRGDDTRPDSAMIERAAKAKALELIKAALSFLAANGKTIERDPWQLAAAAYEAAAAVIVAATAEQIRDDLHDIQQTIYPEDMPEGWHDGFISAVAHIAQVARGFAAASAGPGEGNDGNR